MLTKKRAKHSLSPYFACGFRWGKERSALNRRWPSTKADVASADVPETKQDVTEVQWDLSWMEMSGLLDKP
ncbi:hypothetical protein NHX12_016696 [Muraenolepis orangiensis]|uniref:Uncharacterized protein n=1 Tax=Muraenolepis orangiensis TaxID=630683 RepID=A0A9Q0D6H8_9TELE|nr:hypothetical protein NHX12_016696 [Muraenolepis orangiensis]